VAVDKDRNPLAKNIEDIEEHLSTARKCILDRRG
jgi:hypothetical protein